MNQTSTLTVRVLKINIYEESFQTARKERIKKQYLKACKNAREAMSTSKLKNQKKIAIVSSISSVFNTLVSYFKSVCFNNSVKNFDQLDILLQIMSAVSFAEYIYIIEEGYTKNNYAQ